VRDGHSVVLQDWAGSICRDMVQVARLIDPGEKQGHVAAIRYQLDAVDEPERTPSAALLKELSSGGQSLAQYGLGLAGRTREYFLALAPELNRHRDLLTAEAATSLAKQKEIEATDNQSFDEYLGRYLA